MASLAEALAQTFLPSRCAMCGLGLPLRGSRAGVCGACWSLATPHSFTCPRCGTPEVGHGGECLACILKPPAWSAATSWGPYAGVLRELVLLFKRGGRDELAAPLATLMATAWRKSSWPVPALVVEVPLWWGRRLRRGFNQAQLLARELATVLGSRQRSVLRRRRRTVQTGKGRWERLRLAAGTVAAVGPVPDRVLLIDDVLTTGATATVCSRALARAGAREVYVLTLARTENPGRIP